MENNPLDNLPLETRQRVENALQALGGGTLQNVFVSQFTNAQVTNTPEQYVKHDQAWAHWEYGPVEWALFDKVDWEAIRNKARLTAIIGIVAFLMIIGALLSVVLLLLQPFNPATLVIVLIPAILLLTVLIFLISSASYSTGKAKKRHEARQSQTEPHKVTFSEKGIWEAGTYFGINEIFLNLRSVKMTTQPAVLHFRITTASLGRNNTGHEDMIHVLVPWGHEAEAEQLRKRYYAEVIDAKKKPYNPREPD